MIIRVLEHLHLGFWNILLFAICKQWKNFILFVNNGYLLNKEMDLWVLCLDSFFYFLIQITLSQIERTLPVAGDSQKQEFSFILSKQAYHSISDGHLWFSIFSRPPSNTFTRVQRCTCCFVLLLTAMFLNILYYGQTQDSEGSTNSTSLTFGPLYITPQQVCFNQLFLFENFPTNWLDRDWRHCGNSCIYSKYITHSIISTNTISTSSWAVIPIAPSFVQNQTTVSITVSYLVCNSFD